MIKIQKRSREENDVMKKIDIIVSKKGLMIIIFQERDFSSPRAIVKLSINTLKNVLKNKPPF